MSETDVIHARGFFLYPLARRVAGAMELLAGVELVGKITSAGMTVGVVSLMLWGLSKAPVLLVVGVVAMLPLLLFMLPVGLMIGLTPFFLMEWFVWRAALALRRDETTGARRAGLFLLGFIGLIVFMLGSCLMARP